MKNGTRKSIIPVSFWETYGDKAWYGYSGCLVEFQSCLNDLRYYICSDRLNEAKQVIHQMLGTSGLIEDEILLERLMIVQAYIKDDYALNPTLQALNHLENRLALQVDEVIQNRPPRSILLLGELDFPNEFITEILGLHCIESLQLATDIEKVVAYVEYQLPDILLIMSNSMDKYELKIIGTIRKRYLGTKILYFDQSNHSITRLKRFISMRCNSI